MEGPPISLCFFSLLANTWTILKCWFGREICAIRLHESKVTPWTRWASPEQAKITSNKISSIFAFLKTLTAYVWNIDNNIKINRMGSEPRDNRHCWPPPPSVSEGKSRGTKAANRDGRCRKGWRCWMLVPSSSEKMNLSSQGKATVGVILWSPRGSWWPGVDACVAASKWNSRFQRGTAVTLPDLWQSTWGPDSSVAKIRLK